MKQLTNTEKELLAKREEKIKLRQEKLIEIQNNQKAMKAERLKIKLDQRKEMEEKLKQDKIDQKIARQKLKQEAESKLVTVIPIQVTHLEDSQTFEVKNPSNTQRIVKPQFVPIQNQPVVPTQYQPVVPTQNQQVVPTQNQPVVPTQNQPVVPTQDQPVVPTQNQQVVPTQDQPVVLTQDQPATKSLTGKSFCASYSNSQVCDILNMVSKVDILPLDKKDNIINYIFAICLNQDDLNFNYSKGVIPLCDISTCNINNKQYNNKKILVFDSTDKNTIYRLYVNINKLFSNKDALEKLFNI